MSTRDTVEKLERSAKSHIGVSCKANVGSDQIEVTSHMTAGFIRFTYKKNGVKTDRDTLCD